MMILFLFPAVDAGGVCGGKGAGIQVWFNCGVGSNPWGFLLERVNLCPGVPKAGQGGTALLGILLRRAPPAWPVPHSIQGTSSTLRMRDLWEQG